MKLTCRCGASIEISGDRFSETEIEQWNKFWVKHEESCGPLALGPILRWTCPEPYEFTPEVLAAMAMQIPDPNLCQKCGGVIIPVVYRKGMMICGCKKPDPYQRFRDAIKDGKRVFYSNPVYGTSCIAIRQDTNFVFGVDDDPKYFFIEGVDIPPQPSLDWLDKHGVELTGECRIPKTSDTWVTFTGRNVCDGITRGEFGTICLNNRTYSGRRWIVKRKADDGFEKWFKNHGIDLMMSDYRAEQTWRKLAEAVWTAAQEAAKK